MRVITGGRVPIKSWCGSPEDGCIEQAKNLSNLPFAFKHIALMPDTHQGYGMPIGGVLAAKGAVIPNAVGVDIGCGMCAVKTNMTTQTLEVTMLKQVMGKIRELVPVGFNRHSEKRASAAMPVYSGGLPVVDHEYESARYQLGTLGGGNHFIEIQKDEQGGVWVMIHSGSRNLGKKVADHYNSLAKSMNARWFSAVDPKADLAFLPIGTDEAKNYMAEMQYCLEFSKANRRDIMTAVMSAFQTLGMVDFSPVLDIQHNYAAWENHFGKNVVIHRKGATSARSGQCGIIPGSQGTASYIVEGLGSPDSFMSCSHGAGRRMGRKEASRKLDLSEEIRKMDEAGIIHGIRNKEDLDEAAGAYKDIDVVMAEQSDLVSIRHTLKPMAVVKG